MSDQHKFRYLLPPGTNFSFVSKFKTWLVISVLLMSISVGALFWNKSRHGNYMNWTIDFKGGTEMIFAFKDKAKNEFTKVDVGAVRQALEKSGEADYEVSDEAWDDDNNKHIDGIVIKTSRFS